MSYQPRRARLLAPARRSWAVSIAALAVAALSSRDAAAGGLYYADRGVRPLGRGGAFIAGADDLGAIAYNPAGLYEAGAAILVDGSWVQFASEYTRESISRQVDPNTGETTATFRTTHPTVQGTTPFLPIPTLAGSFQPHRQWVVAAGVWAPYATLTTYPSEVNGKPAPQRYSLISLEGSMLASLGLAAAFAPTPEWRIGATFKMLVGQFNTQVAFSACVPERFFCAPEDPDWDVLAELSGGPIFAPSGEVGAIYIPHPAWRVGLSVNLPTWVRSPAKMRTRLPAAPLFENASQEGDTASLDFELPWSIRAGVETRIVKDLRIEASFAFEQWGMHDTIAVDPDGVALKNVAGFPETYYIPEVTLARNFKDAFSAKLGAEYGFTLFNKRWEVRGGVNFESSSIPKEYLHVLTLDSNKVTTSLGMSFHIGALRLDATYAHVFATNVTVPVEEARISQVSPVDANPPRDPNYINGGTYSGYANVVGLGLTYSFSPGPADSTAPAPEPAPTGK